MKKLIVIFIFSLFLSTTIAKETQPSKPQYRTEKMVLQEFHDKSEGVLKGPFLLNIKSITTKNNKTFLNTERSQKHDKNIVVEMPAFITTQFVKNLKSDVNILFLNQNLIVKGNMKLVEKNDPEAKNPKLIPTLKVFSINQITHYD